MGIGHSYTLVWQAAEWLIREMDVEEEAREAARRSRPKRPRDSENSPSGRFCPHTMRLLAAGLYGEPRADP